MNIESIATGTNHIILPKSLPCPRTKKPKHKQLILNPSNKSKTISSKWAIATAELLADVRKAIAAAATKHPSIAWCKGKEVILAV